ncbi:hypothetical protein V8G54_027619 [Vigna mungo]|uniref:Wound-responsive family protein n=1 Tax=Vigna mungo TaxID=3915 RepID=A0AAQ3N2Z9_VIGMU
MSSPKRAWTVVVGVGVVEALKDQGLCRWNSGFKSAQQSVKSHVGSFSQAKKLSSSSSAVVSSKMHEENATLSEESLRKVMKEKDNMGKLFCSLNVDHEEIVSHREGNASCHFWSAFVYIITTAICSL